MSDQATSSKSKLGGRKEIIFDAALELFSLLGYEKVSMKAIAKKSGIKASSIYNHFSGKSEILEAIYQYYVDHMFDNAPTAESLKAAGHEPGLSGLMQAANWSFESLPPKICRRLIRVHRLVLGNFLYDAQANHVFGEYLLKRHKERRKELLEYARSLGLISPAIDLDEMAEILVYGRLMLYIVALAKDFNGEGDGMPDERLGRRMLKLLENGLRGGAGAPGPGADLKKGGPKLRAPNKGRVDK